MSAPETSFYVAGGTLRHDAPSYVERRADRDVSEGLLAGEFCYVLTPRQMGKSSLMVRTASKLREQGVNVIALDLTAIGQNLTAEQWYDGLVAIMGRQLGMDEELERYWREHERLGPCQRLFAAIRDVVLRQRPGALAIFVDEIDSVRSLPFSTDEFFAAMRECYNRRAEDPELNRVTFCLLGVATPSDLIRDTRTTPFNIGRRIELDDFSRVEAAPLAQGLRDTVTPDSGRPGAAEGAAAAVILTSGRLLTRILHWTGGHPYLTQRLCRAVAEDASVVDATGVDRICEDLFLSSRARERDDNLLFVRERLLRSETDLTSLLEQYRKVRSGKRVPDDETSRLISVLRLSGIVASEEGFLRERNRIYSHVFDGEWIRAHLPDAELRRQRAAFRRGLVRATTIAAAIVLAMAALAVWALRSRNEANEATLMALRDRARLGRMLGMSGQRFETLDPIRQAARITPSPELRDEAIASLALPDLRRQSVRVTPDRNATALLFSDDQQLYAFSNPSGEIVVHRAEGAQEIARWPAGTDAVRRLWFSHDGQWLAVAQTNRSATILSLWRWSGAEKLFTVTNEMQPEAFDISPDSRRLALGDERGVLRLLAVPGGQVQAEAELGAPCTVVRFDPTGRRLAVASSDSLKVGVYDAALGNRVTTLHSASPPVHLAWHPDGQWLAAACEDQRGRLWDIDSDEYPKGELPRQMSDFTALAFNRSGTLLASAFVDRSVRLWSAEGRLLLTAADAGNIHQLQFSPDDRRLGFAVSGDAVWFWEVAAGEECRTLFDFDADELSAIDVHPNGRLLAIAHGNGVTFWDLASARRLGSMAVGGTTALRFHPVSGELVNSEFRGTYRFRIQTSSQPGEHGLLLKPREDFYLGPGALALDFARDGDVLAVTYDDRVRLTRSTNSAYAVIRELVGEPGFKTVGVSPDGRYVAAGNWKGAEVWLWDLTTPAKPRRLRVDGRAHLCFSPDGRWLATGTEKKAVLWDTRSWEPSTLAERPPGATRPTPVAFTQNGRMIAMTLNDTRVCLLDQSGRTLAELEAPGKDLLVGLVFSPDGSRLACATAARTVVLWDIESLARGLTQLGLGHDLETPGPARQPEPPMAVEIGEMDRLRFSQARHIIGLRREIAELDGKIQDDPTAWHLYMYRADRLKKLGDFEAAAGDYRRWIELDRAAINTPTDAMKAWPLRDLAWLHLFGPGEMRDYGKALTLTQEALELEPENADNHYRHAVACFRLERYGPAETHFEAARQRYEASKKNITAVLFYQAMCQAQQNQASFATQLLDQARQSYARMDLKTRERRAGELTDLADLLYEAERIVSQANAGG